jgi:hypothetical protein
MAAVYTRAFNVVIFVNELVNLVRGELSRARFHVQNVLLADVQRDFAFVVVIGLAWWVRAMGGGGGGSGSQWVGNALVVMAGKGARHELCTWG